MEHQTSPLLSNIVVHSWHVDTPRAIVILQHGFGECAERYVGSHHNIIQELNQAGFEVRAMDLQGHGRSLGDRGVAYIGKAVQDHVLMRTKLLQVTTTTTAKTACPIFLLAHSLGGLVTVGSVISDPSNLRGVILLSPALPAPMPRLIRFIVEAGAFFVPSWSIPVPGRTRTELTRLPAQQQLCESDPLLMKRQIPFVLAATALRVAENNFNGALKSWHVPTLVMHGTADRYTSHEQSEKFVEAIAAKDKKHRSFPGAYHELLNDSDRDDALQDILQWLEAHMD